MFHGAQNIIQEQAEDFTRNMQKKNLGTTTLSMSMLLTLSKFELLFFEWYLCCL